MGATAKTLNELTDVKSAVPPVTFNPTELFSPNQLTLSSLGTIPPQLPASFVLTPVVQKGNINLIVSQINPPGFAWTVRSATVNKGNSVSIVMGVENGSQLLVLTGAKGVGGPNTWASNVNNATGTFSRKQLPISSSFKDHFSWSFLLEPDNTDDNPETVILKFEIEVTKDGEGGGVLQQFYSFPPDWKAIDFGQDQDGGILFTLSNPNDKTYKLCNGLFAGELGCLVCQGDLTIAPASSGGALVVAPDGGNWTGTSGGPV